MQHRRVVPSLPIGHFRPPLLVEGTRLAANYELAGRHERAARGLVTTFMQRGIVNMAREQPEPRIERRNEGARVEATAGAEPSLGDLFKRLTTDTGELVRQEMNLAKAEMRQAGATLARDGTKIGIALGLALLLAPVAARGQSSRRVPLRRRWCA